MYIPNWIKNRFPTMQSKMVRMERSSEDTDKLRLEEIERLNGELALMRENLEEEIDRRHESEHRALALSEAASCAIIIHRDDNVLIVNKLFRDMCGFDESCFRVNPDLFWGLFVEPSREEMKRRIDEKDMEAYGAKIRTASGLIQTVWVDPIMVPYNGHGLCRAERIHAWKERHA